MKKFYTSIPLQVRGNLGKYVYAPVGNSRLGMEEPTSFPIIPAINGYVEPGERFRLIAVVPDSEDGKRNMAALEQEIGALCARKGIVCERGVETVAAAEDERVSSHTGVFQSLIDFAEEDDELFACVTYGTKPQSMTLLMAVQYAYRMKKNASVSCIVYGKVDHNTKDAFIYDETALVQMDEIVRMLAERKVPNPKAVIDGLLSL